MGFNLWVENVIGMCEKMMNVLRSRWEFVGSYRHLLTGNRLFTWAIVWIVVIVSEFQSWRTRANVT